MSLVTISDRWGVRGGTAANLAAVNEIPLVREMILETDTLKFKFGDGTTHYNDLDYVGILKAADLPYDPTTSGLSATDVQAAIDQLAATAAGGGYAQGTSNPATPASGDKFYRTDLNLLIYYDGTRWLTVQQFESGGGLADALFPITTNLVAGRWPVRQDFGIYLVRLNTVAYTLATNNASNYWSVALQTATGTGTTATIGTFNTSADTAANFVNHDIAINAVIGSTIRQIQLLPTKVGTPGGIYLPSSLCYRLIVP